MMSGRQSGPGTPVWRRAIEHVAAAAVGPPLEPELRVTVHFHPDRLAGGELVLTRLAREGVYRSQFETGTSNGGLTAYPGGARWKWESRMFGGAYDGSPAEERPKYGGLNHRGRAVGAAPRFGSSYLRLAAGTLERTTFCFPDSVYEPRHFGTAERMGLIPLVEAAEGDPLDQYNEAHVHGPLEIRRDVEAIVLDPCYRGTAVEEAARRLPCALEWHGGFRLHADVLRQNPEYRGAEFVALGVLLARDGWLTPLELGDAERTERYDPQAIKRVWHYLASFGVDDPGGSE